jgi:hypothetical protein
MTRRAAPARPQGDSALALAIRRREYERAALCLLAGFAEAWRRLPDGAIDDVLALLASADDDARRDG